MFVWDPRSYGPSIAGLIDIERLGELGPGRTHASARSPLAALQLDSAFAPQSIVDGQMARCCLAGLWLGNNFLDESHSICQAINTPSGSYWHGFMHRREPDFSNARYWFRRVGGHPIFEALGEAGRGIASSLQVTGPAEYLATQTDWDPLRFVDLCQSVDRGDVTHQDVCRQIARTEWQLLFDHCYRQAVGSDR